MAEIGLAASIVGVAGVGAQLAVNLYSFAETVNSAEKNIKAIAAEVSLTSAVLEQLSEALKQDAQVQVASNKAFQTAEGIVEECSQIFKDIDGALEKSLCSAKRSAPPSKGQKIVISLPGRLKWPFLQPKMQLLSANLGRLKSTLLLMLHVLIYARRLSAEKQLPSPNDFERIEIENLDRSKQQATWSFENMRKAITSEDDTIGSRAQTEAPEGMVLDDPKPINSFKMMNNAVLDHEPLRPGFHVTDPIRKHESSDSVHLPAPTAKFPLESVPPGNDSMLSRIARIRTFVAVIDETQRHIEFARSNAYPLGGLSNTASDPEGLVVLNPGTISQIFAYFPGKGGIEWLRGDGELWSLNEVRRFSRFQERHLRSDFALDFSSSMKKHHIEGRALEDMPYKRAPPPPPEASALAFAGSQSLAYAQRTVPQARNQKKQMNMIPPMSMGPQVYGQPVRVQRAAEKQSTPLQYNTSVPNQLAQPQGLEPSGGRQSNIESTSSRTTVPYSEQTQDQIMVTALAEEARKRVGQRRGATEERCVEDDSSSEPISKRTRRPIAIQINWDLNKEERLQPRNQGNQIDPGHKTLCDDSAVSTVMEHTQSTRKRLPDIEPTIAHDQVPATLEPPIQPTYPPPPHPAPPAQAPLYGPPGPTMGRYRSPPPNPTSSGSITPQLSLSCYMETLPSSPRCMETLPSSPYYMETLPSSSCYMKPLPPTPLPSPPDPSSIVNTLLSEWTTLKV